MNVGLAVRILVIFISSLLFSTHSFAKLNPAPKGKAESHKELLLSSLSSCLEKSKTQTTNLNCISRFQSGLENYGIDLANHDLAKCLRAAQSAFEIAFCKDTYVQKEEDAPTKHKFVERKSNLNSI